MGRKRRKVADGGYPCRFRDEMQNMHRSLGAAGKVFLTRGNRDCQAEGKKERNAFYEPLSFKTVQLSVFSTMLGRVP